MSAETPEFLKPRLRLFLSADIVGSTALKQSPFSTKKVEQSKAWFNKIHGFYFEADQAFRREFNATRDRLKEPLLTGPPPVLWKTIGDEVVFVKELTDHRQLVETLRSWMAAVPAVRDFLKKGNQQLDVKCTAWLAGFPLRNSEVAVQKGAALGDYGSGDAFVESGKILERLYGGDKTVDAVVDYIGPSIDVGFRLTGFCTSRKFIISVDVAHLLARASAGSSVKDPVFSIYFDGSEIMKGVIGGLRYPIFWLDLSPTGSLVRFEDGLTTLEPVDRDRLGEFCNRFYQEHSRYTFPPFIFAKSEQQFADYPEDYLKDL